MYSLVFLIPIHCVTFVLPATSLIHCICFTSSFILARTNFSVVTLLLFGTACYLSYKHWSPTCGERSIVYCCAWCHGGHVALSYCCAIQWLSHNPATRCGAKRGEGRGGKTRQRSTIVAQSHSSRFLNLNSSRTGRLRHSRLNPHAEISRHVSEVLGKNKMSSRHTPVSKTNSFDYYLRVHRQRQYLVTFTPFL
jgi:hypothetical protein